MENTTKNYSTQQAFELDASDLDVVVTRARKERRLSRHSNNEALEPSFSFLFRRVLLAVPTLRSRRALGKQ
jgi:hypothetical protein